MSTLISLIEAILNSWPLTLQLSDPNDLCTLISEPNLIPYAPTRLERWQLLTFFQQTFWKRWSLKYLSSLQSRVNWIHPRINIKTCDHIILHTPKLPYTSWNMGRVELVRSGKDRVVKMVTERTADSLYKRPVMKLTVLPI